MEKEYENKIIKRKPKVKHLDTTMCIKIDKQLLENFKDTCKKNNISYSKVIRELMKKYVEKEK